MTMPSGDRELMDAVLARIANAKRENGEELDLARFPIAVLPDEIGELSHLKSLVLGSTWQQKNQRPLADLKPLARLVGLKKLHLGWCRQLSDLAPLSALAELESLKLIGCTSVSDFSPLSDLKSLKALWLGLTMIDDLQVLQALAELNDLDLTQCLKLNDISPLARLTKLRRLNLNQCSAVRDISPLGRLQQLEVFEARGLPDLKDVSTLKGCSALKSLTLTGCSPEADFAPLQPLMPQLTFFETNSGRSNALPSTENEIQTSDMPREEVRVEARRNVKVCVIGNSGVGKTQLCRRLVGQEFDPAVPLSTGLIRGIKDYTVTSSLYDVRLHIWDLAGDAMSAIEQAYFTNHAGVILLLWNPASEELACSGRTTDRTLKDQLDYARRLAKGAPIIVVQTQCDAESDMAAPPIKLPKPVTKATDDTKPRKESTRPIPLPFAATACSSQTSFGLDALGALLDEAVKAQPSLRKISHHDTCRSKVQNRIHAKLEKQRDSSGQSRPETMEFEQFKRWVARAASCAGPGDVVNALLCGGVASYFKNWFGNQVVFDHDWLSDVAYAFSDPHLARLLKERAGRVTSNQILASCWSHRTPTEKQQLLDGLETADQCFKSATRGASSSSSPSEISPSEAWEYVVPIALPSRPSPDVMEFVNQQEPLIAVNLNYRFLHASTLRRLLVSVGREAKGDGVYWKYGCWVRFGGDQRGLCIEGQIANDRVYGPGTITLRGWRDNVRAMIDRLVANLSRDPLSREPTVT